MHACAILQRWEGSQWEETPQRGAGLPKVCYRGAKRQLSVLSLCCETWLLAWVVCLGELSSSAGV